MKQTEKFYFVALLCLQWEEKFGFVTHVDMIAYPYVYKPLWVIFRGLSDLFYL